MFSGTIEFPYLICAAPIAIQMLILFFGFMFKKFVTFLKIQLSMVFSTITMNCRMLPWSSYHYERFFAMLICLMWALGSILVAAKVACFMSMCVCVLINKSPLLSSMDYYLKILIGISFSFQYLDFRLAL